jgi:hypothetical protein
LLCNQNCGKTMAREFINSESGKRLSNSAMSISVAYMVVKWTDKQTRIRTMAIGSSVT